MGNFQKLRVWQEGMDLAIQIYNITRKGSFAKDFGLKNQIQRAAVSIPSNIAEGDERATDNESVYYFNIAKGSVAEVITQLYIAKEIGYMNKEKFEVLINKAEKIRASLKRLISARKIK